MMNLSCPRDELSRKYQILKASRSQQNHYNQNYSVLFCYKRSNCVYCAIMMATCTEMILFFPNIKRMIEQFQTSRRSPTKCKKIAYRMATGRRQIGDWLATYRRMVGDLTSGGKTVAVVVEVANKISHQEVALRSQDLWDRGFAHVRMLNLVFIMRRSRKFREGRGVRVHSILLVINLFLEGRGGSSVPVFFRKPIPSKQIGSPSVPCKSKVGGAGGQDKCRLRRASAASF